MEYTDANRGRIQYRDRARQIIDFGGIRFDKITPTDIDGFFEYHDTVFVFYEMKLRGKDMPRGQRTALCNLVDALLAAGKYAILFKCYHDAVDPSQDVIAADTEVAQVYVGNGIWRDGMGETAFEATSRFKQFAERLGPPMHGMTCMVMEDGRIRYAALAA